MKIYGMTSTRKNETKAKGKFIQGVRIICAVLCITLLLGTCIGCTSYASTDEMTALQRELDVAVAEINSMNEEYSATAQELEILNGLYEEAKATLDELDTAYKNTQKDLESAKDAAEDADAAAKQELDSLKSALESAQEEMEAMKESLDAAEEELNDLKGKYDEAQNEIADLKEQIENNNGGSSDKIKIYIDQGHNPTSYHNAGATGNGLYEQDLTFEIGKILEKLLEDDGRFEIRMSRPTAGTVLGTDVDSSLDARVQGATDFGADYFISLHINSFTSDTVSGIEAYSAEQGTEAFNFGTILLQGMEATTNLRNRGMKVNPDLRVLKNATMPAVLLEMGFISNPDDAALLDETPEVFAEGIYDGILTYFNFEPNNEATN